MTAVSPPPRHPAPGGGPSVEDPIRERLFEAAANVFASKGYLGTKLTDIVKAAGLSSGAVYGRFESKDELLVAAVVRAVEGNAPTRWSEDSSVAESLIRVVQAHGALDDSEAMQIEAFIAARRSPQVAEAIAQTRRRWRAAIAHDLVPQAIADGSASPDADFDSIVFLIETLHLGLLVQRGAGQEVTDPERWQQFVGRTVRQIANGAPAKAQSGLTHDE